MAKKEDQNEFSFVRPAHNPKPDYQNLQVKNLVTAVIEENPFVALNSKAEEFKPSSTAV